MQASHWVRGIGALIFFGLGAAALAADKRPFASSDFTSLRSALPVAISPDGKTILFDVQSFDEKGPVKDEWHTVPVAGGGDLKLDLPEKFTPSGFTRDGALFGEYRIDDQTQLAIVPLTSGKPTLIFALPRGSRAPAISPDGTKIAVLSDSRAKDKHDQHNVVENDQASLYVFDLHSQGGAWWCQELRTISDFAWSKDSSRLAVVTQLPKLGNHDEHSMLHVCGTDGSRQLADVPTATAGVAWSADEKELVFASTKTPTLTAEHVWTVALSGGAPMDRTPDLDATATTVKNHHGVVLVEVHRGVRTEIDSFGDGELTPMLRWPNGTTTGMPAANPFADTPDVVAVGVGDPEHSNNVAVVKDGQLQKITSEGDTQLAGISLGETKVVHWTSKEGIKLEGIATFPPGYTAGKRYPFLVFPHGGPEANDQLGLDPMAKYIAGKNYVVLQPEYRGSTGYGTAHLAAIYQHFGDRAYRDVDSATDFAIAQGWADPARLAMFGWSAGGFMTSWTVTQTHRYKAAIEGAGITDWLSFIPTSDTWQTDYDARLQEKDASPMLKFSAVMFADRVTTPLLILHGSADIRVPTFQGFEFYALLKERGKTVRMVTYPGSPHFPRLAEQRRDVLDEVGSWLDKYNPLPAHLADGPVIHIEDVAAFYKLYDATNGHPTADQLQHDYLDPGSEGLHNLAKVRNVTGARIADNIAKHPEIYSDARQCMAALPRVRQRVGVALRELGRLYPEARFPPVTIVVGRGKPVGVGSPVTGLQIGLEALCAVKWMDPNVEDRFVRVIAHEYIHVQQAAALSDDEHPTLLERSLVEGGAEFGAELLTGQPVEVTSPQMEASTRGHEKEIESAFLTDEDNTDLSKWLDNSSFDKLGDLGYWVGYRIVKAYYQHASDERRALREIIEMTDPKAFLAKSGWFPGIKVQ